MLASGSSCKHLKTIREGNESFREFLNISCMPVLDVRTLNKNS